VPISDDEFSTVTKGIALNSAATALFIFLILWLALRSFHLVFAVGITLAIGLIITAGIGVLVAGALNPISMAFAILFVGLGAGFSVQFNVRYRARRFVTHDLPSADAICRTRWKAAYSCSRGSRSWFFVIHADGLHRAGTARENRRMRDGDCLSCEVYAPASVNYPCAAAR